MKYLLLLLLSLHFLTHEIYTFPCVVNGGPFGGVKYPALNHHVTSFVHSIDIMFDAVVTITGYTLNEVAATIEFTSNNNGLMIPQSAAINGNNITLFTEYIKCDNGPNCGYEVVNPQTIFFTSDEVNVTAVYRPLELLSGSVNVGGIPLLYGQSLCTSWIDRLIPSITNIGFFKNVGSITIYQIMFNKPVSTCSGIPVQVLQFFTAMDFPTYYVDIFGTNNMSAVNGIVPNRLWTFATNALYDNILKIRTIAPGFFCDTVGQGNIGYNRTTSFAPISFNPYQISVYAGDSFFPFNRLRFSQDNVHIMPRTMSFLDRDRNGFPDAIVLNLDGAVNITSVTQSTFTFGTCTGILSNLTSVQQVLPIGSNVSDSFVLKLNNIQVSFTTGTVSGCLSAAIAPIQLVANSSMSPLLTSISNPATLNIEYSALPPTILSAVYIPGSKQVVITTNRIGSEVNISSFRFLTSHAAYYTILNISTSSLTSNVTINDYIRGPLLSDSSTPLKAFITMRAFVTGRIKPYWKGVVVTEGSPRFMIANVAVKSTNFTEIEIVFATTGLLSESFNSTLLTLSCNYVPIVYSIVSLSNTTLVLYVPLSTCSNGLPMTIDMVAHTIVNATAGNEAVINRTIDRIPTMTVSSTAITPDRHLKIVLNVVGPVVYDSFSLVIEFYCDNKLVPISFQLIEGNTIIYTILGFCDIVSSFIKKLYIPDNIFFALNPPSTMLKYNNITIVPTVPHRFNPAFAVIKVYPYDIVQITFGNVDALNISGIFLPYLKMYCNNILSTDLILYNQQLSSIALEFNITSCPDLSTTTFDFQQNFIFTLNSISERITLTPTIPHTFELLSATLYMDTRSLIIHYFVGGIRQITTSLFNLTCTNERAVLTLISYTSSVITFSVSDCSYPYSHFSIAEKAVLTATQMSEQASNIVITVIDITPTVYLTSVMVSVSISTTIAIAIVLIILSLLPNIITGRKMII